MLKQTVEYTNLEGVKVETDLYFNISKIELLEIGLDTFVERIKKMSQEQNALGILKELKEFVHTAYGEKSDDGKRFVKSIDMLERFKASPAYDEFLFGLATDVQKSVAFVNGLFPDEYLEDIKARIDSANKSNEEHAELLKKTSL